MVKQELIAGLKNAVERGTDLERAKHSFISAGYPPEEVEEAARAVREGSVFPQQPALPVRAQPREIVRSEKAVKPEETVKPVKPVRPIEGSVKGKIRRNLKIIVLIIILAALLGILTLTIMFRETIINWFG